MTVNLKVLLKTDKEKFDINFAEFSNFQTVRPLEKKMIRAVIKYSKNILTLFVYAVIFGLSV